MIALERHVVRFLTLAMSALLVTSFSPPVARAAGETINVWTDSGNDDEPLLKAVAAAFEKANPSVRVVVNVGPAGDPAVQEIKQKLNAGTMTDDVFVYYAGSLFQGLDPTKNLVELTNEPWQSDVISSYYPGVSVGKRIYGAPFGSAMGGGILYNKAVYKKLGLKIPLTWKAFMENNANIKKAKLIPVIQTYGDSWSAQILILADSFNLQSAVPTFAALYTSNRVKVSKVPPALAGFQHLADIHKAGYQNKDFATAKLADGLKYLISGQGAHYPMLTFVATDLDRMNPKLADGIGIFAEPGPSAKSNGLTIWMPNGLFIPKTTRHLMTAQNFIAFAKSPAGVAAMNAAVAPSGPYLLKGVRLTGHVSQITLEMQKYFNANGKTAPALEFVTPIKGPNLPKISVQVGSGIKSALQGATSYDLDVTRESQRLGLPEWGQLPG